MSKEAEEFFRQKTIENAKRPRMKKFLALVNRKAEGKILQEYADQQLILSGVSQQRKLLEDYQHFMDWNEEHDRKASTSERIESFIAYNYLQLKSV